MTVADELALGAAALHAIAAIVKAIESAKAGTVPVAEVLARLTTLHESLAANNAAADAAEDARFPPKGPGRL